MGISSNNTSPGEDILSNDISSNNILTDEIKKNNFAENV